MRDTWTDERLDDFRDEVNRRFDKVDRRFDEAERHTEQRFDQVDKRFDQVDKRFDLVDKRLDRLEDRFYSMQRTIIIVGGATIATLLGVIGTGIAT